MSEKDPFELEQVSVRLVSAPPLYSTETVNSPEAAIRIMADELKDYDREVACVINLKTDYEPINFSICSMGALDQALIHPREMMKNMFLSNANSVIVVHNHPSGNLTPSQQDIAMTDRLAQLCSLAGIGLLDHIVIGGGNDKTYYSMKENDQISVNQVRFAKDIGNIQWPEAVAAEEKQEYNQKQPQNKTEEKAETVSENKPSVLAELNEKKAEIKEKDETYEERNEKPLTADDVTNIKVVMSEYSPHLRTATHILNCEIRGVPDVLTYKVTQHDYGDGFTLHSQKNDIWNTMDRKEMLQLEDIVSEEVIFHGLSEAIDKTETMRELRDIRYDIVMGDDLNLSEEHTAKLYDKLDQRENELIEASLPQAKDEKRSVLEQLNEKKDEASKMPEIQKMKTHTEKETR